MLDNKPVEVTGSVELGGFDKAAGSGRGGSGPPEGGTPGDENQFPNEMKSVQ